MSVTLDQPQTFAPELRNGSVAFSPKSNRHRQALLLFDIDGTLLREEASAAHLAAVHSAITTVYGLKDPAAVEVQTWGKTDLQIAREILTASGYFPQSFRGGGAAFCKVAAREHAARCPCDLSGYVISGIPALLEYLAGREDAQLGLVTGNIRAIALLKLSRAGIGEFFAAGIGAFGCEAENRAALAAIARARAGTPTRPHASQRTWIIGDTPLDIRCARADGTRCLAMTSGPYHAGELSAADHVARDVAELRSILDRELECNG